MRLTASITLNGRYRKTRVSLVVNKATFTNAFPVSELNVWNRMANQALPGQFETFE